MLLALALLTLVTCVDGIGNITQCPKGCNCKLAFFGTQLYVHCDRGVPDVDTKQLSHQLDLMLSAEHHVAHLTSLTISNTTLTHVPASVCKLVNLTSLNLNGNKLISLPDNCFTQLTKLVTLSATRNSITGLQDGLLDGMQSLVSIHLAFNHIFFIGLRVFSNSSDLTRLRSVSLYNNRLTSLEPWWYYRCILGSETSPVRIWLNHNLISKFYKRTTV